MSTKRVLLIDGDTLAYQQSILAEQPIDWGDGFWTLHAYSKEVIAAVENRIANFIEDLQADEAVICLSDHNNFRQEILPTYKEHRKKTRRPLCLGDIREHLIFKHKALIYPRLEADDVIGINSTENLRRDSEIIIVGIDKDYKTIPCKFYNPDKPDLGIVEQSPLEADRFWMMQALMGDAVDGYKGCPTVGPKKAEALLGFAESFDEMWEIVKNTYVKNGLTELDAIVHAQVSRILRFGDYNKKTKKINVWTPKK